MPTVPKVVVIGNCQARPVSTLLGFGAAGIEILEPVIVQISNDASAEADIDRITRADVVLTQPIADDYRCGHVRTVSVRALNSNVALWPNAFFRGYNPELFYIRRPGKPTLQGPLGDYHLQPILDGFLAGESTSATAERLRSASSNIDRYSGVAQQSLAQLESRETDLQVQISAYVRQHWHRIQLFHTFNHPRLSILIEMVSQMRTLIGLPPEPLLSPAMLAEPLGQYCLPTNTGFLQTLATEQEFDAVSSFKRPNYSIDGDRVVPAPGFDICSAEAMVCEFFLFYENCESSDLKAAAG